MPKHCYLPENAAIMQTESTALFLPFYNLRVSTYLKNSNLLKNCIRIYFNCRKSQSHFLQDEPGVKSIMKKLWDYFLYYFPYMVSLCIRCMPL